MLDYNVGNCQSHLNDSEDLKCQNMSENVRNDLEHNVVVIHKISQNTVILFILHKNISLKNPYLSMRLCILSPKSVSVLHA